MIDLTLRKRYERRGSCARCGLCCADEACEDLAWVAKTGDAFCMRHTEDRGLEDCPQKCQYFPQQPPILNPECGFHFVDTWEDNRPVRTGKDL